MKKILFLTLATAALVLLVSVSTAAEEAKPEAAKLLGTWSVDLRPTPDADPYFQPMTISSIDVGEIQATFYGAATENGAVNTDWDAVRFAFTTEDGSGVYHTTGVLREDGTIEGTTHSLGRGFLSYWTATRE